MKADGSVFAKKNLSGVVEMFPFKLFKKHIKQNRVAIPFGISVLIAGLFACFKSTNNLNSDYISHIFAIVALYSGTFLAFYALIFGWVTSSSPPSIGIEGFKTRLGYIESAMNLVILLSP